MAERIEGDQASWFEEERIGLVAAVEQACENDLLELTWELARALSYFFKQRTHWTDWQHTQRLALRAAWCAQNRLATANALRSLGDVSWQLQQFDKSIARLGRAMTRYLQAAGPTGRGLGPRRAWQRLLRAAAP